MIHKQRVAMAIAAGVGMLATFMPWVEAPFFGSVPGHRGDGWITLVIFAVALVPALANDRAKPLVGGQLLMFSVPGVVCAVIGASKISNFRANVTPFTEANPVFMSGEFAKAEPLQYQLLSGLSVGVGLYMVVGAGIAVAVLPFLLKEAPSNVPTSSQPPATTPDGESK